MTFFCEKRIARIVGLIGLLMGLLCMGCGGAPSAETAAGFLRPDGPEQPDDLVALITIDTWRVDAFGLAENAKARTPNLATLAREGVVFDNAYAHAVVTLPSHASILTGLYPHRHGIRDNAGFRLDPAHETLAVHFKRAGYQTAAFVSAFPLDSRYGLDQGFEVYDDGYEAYRNEAGMPQRPGEETIARALAWLEAAPPGPKFLWLHLYEPHFPYEPPEPYRSEYADAPYYGEAAYVDALLAPLIERARQAESATVAVTSDHGEGLGEHGELTHGVFAYDATLKTPLFIWSPNRLKPGAVQHLTRHVDLAPTLLALANLAVPDGLDGQPLFAGDYREEASYFEALSPYLNRGWAPLRGCLDSGKKSIELPILELYDLAADPGERHNLAEDDPALARAFLLCVPEERNIGWNRADLTSEERAKLEALGYVASSSDSGARAQLKDPKLLIEYDRRFQNALSAFHRGAREQAIAELERLSREQPDMTVAYLYLSDFYESARRPGLAIQTLRRARDNGARDELTTRKLALLLTQTGQIKDALALVEPFADSADPETQAAFGKMYAGLGRFEQAQAAFERALALDATNAQAYADFGTLYLYAKRRDRAEALFRQALEQNPCNASAWNGLGVARAEAEDVDGAIEAWERAIECDPELAFCYYNLALFYEKKGRLDLALERLKTYAGLVTGEQREKALRKIRQLEQM